MKQITKKIGFFALVGFFAIAAQGVHAQEDTRKSELKAETRIEAEARTNINIKDVVQGKIEDRKEENRENRDARVEVGDDRKVNGFATSSTAMKMRITNASKWMEKRFEAAVERLEKIVDRIESRIAKLKAEGKVTLDAEAEIVIANKEITEAKVGISQIASTTEAAFLSGDLADLKELAREIKADVKAAHASLVRAIVNLKPGRNEAKTSTSTEVVQ